MAKRPSTGVSPEVPLPPLLQEAIAKELEGISLSSLANASEGLSSKYRSNAPGSSYVATANERLAYLVARLPATYGVIYRVLEEAIDRVPGIACKDMLDVGAGPGTGTWAASLLFPALEQIDLLEKDPGFIALGKKLMLQGDFSARLSWHPTDVAQAESLPKRDLVLLSYMLGEIDEKKRSPLLQTCKEAAQKLLIIIEPGTPAGFERMRKAREELIHAGLQLAAPCPHMQKCPMTNGDWCHFAERIQRTAVHRKIKQGALGHEDEKYAYLVFSKTAVERCKARILRHPQKTPGRVSLTLCTERGIQLSSISKKEKELYRQAKKADWGDGFTTVSCGKQGGKEDA